MGIEALIEPSQFAFVPLSVLLLFLIANGIAELRAAVLVGAVLFAIAATFEYPMDKRSVTRFAVFFCVSSVASGFPAFIAALLIDAFRRSNLGE